MTRVYRVLSPDPRWWRLAPRSLAASLVTATLVSLADPGGRANAQAQPDTRASGTARSVDLDASQEYYRGYRDALRDVARVNGRWGGYRRWSSQRHADGQRQEGQGADIGQRLSPRETRSGRWHNPNWQREREQTAWNEQRRNAPPTWPQPAARPAATVPSAPTDKLAPPPPAIHPGASPSDPAAPPR